MHNSLLTSHKNTEGQLFNKEFHFCCGTLAMVKLKEDTTTTIYKINSNTGKLFLLYKKSAINMLQSSSQLESTGTQGIAQGLHFL